MFSRRLFNSSIIGLFCVPFCGFYPKKKLEQYVITTIMPDYIPILQRASKEIGKIIDGPLAQTVLTLKYKGESAIEYKVHKEYILDEELKDYDEEKVLETYTLRIKDTNKKFMVSYRFHGTNNKETCIMTKIND